VKIEAKLFNIDKVNVASIYLEMQRDGGVMLKENFLKDIT
jgi:hypothetical protein